ncbi:MAG: hypothetical protein JXB39_14610 [Deltaproteobacteria bacterium]|nr:hypothetical protein [Deltaproteobacteria bacterium]
MLALRWIQVVLAACVCLLLAASLAGGGSPRILAYRPESVRPAPQAPDADPALAAFLGTLTPDDVARGVWDLAIAPGAPAPDAARAALVAGPLAEARDLHDRLSALRGERRRLERSVLQDGAHLWEITRAP